MTDYKLSKGALIRQILLALCSSLGFLGTGLIRGYSSPGVPSMEATAPHLVPDDQAISWIISASPLGSFLGGLVTMPWMHYMGRKRVIQIIGPLFALSWCGIALSNSTAMLIFSRASAGFTAGVVLPVTQVYVSECSHPRIRGLLASLPATIMVGGTVLQFLFGLVLDWRGMAWISAVFPAALVLVLIPFPESPPWLKLKGKKTRSEEAYKWFGLRPDLEHSQDDDETNKQLNPDQGVLPDSSSRIQSSFCSRGVLIPLSLGLAIIIFQQTCGNDVITFNTVLIFRSSGSTLDSYLATIIFGAVHFIFVFISVFLVDKFGRRCLLIFSSLVMGISIGSLSLYYFLHEAGKASHLTLLPVISLTVYIAGYSLGFCPIPYIIMGEIYPLAYRSVLGPLTNSIGLLAMFTEVKTYSDLLHYFGHEGAFAFYSVMNFVAAVFIYFLLPETKGKSLEEIELHFSRNHKKKVKFVKCTTGPVSK